MGWLRNAMKSAGQIYDFARRRANNPVLEGAYGHPGPPSRRDLMKQSWRGREGHIAGGDQKNVERLLWNRLYGPSETMNLANPRDFVGTAPLPQRWIEQTPGLPEPPIFPPDLEWNARRERGEQQRLLDVLRGYGRVHPEQPSQQRANPGQLAKWTQDRFGRRLDSRHRSFMEKMDDAAQRYKAEEARLQRLRDQEEHARARKLLEPDREAAEEARREFNKDLPPTARAGTWWWDVDRLPDEQDAAAAMERVNPYFDAQYGPLRPWDTGDEVQNKIRREGKEKGWHRLLPDWDTEF